MAKQSIEDLITPLTPVEVAAKIYELMVRLRLSTTAWKPGAVVRTIVSAVSIVFAAISVLIANIARSAFVSTSHGKWLRLKAAEDYGIDWVPASAAAGGLVVVNNSGGTYDFEIGDLIVASSVTGKYYTNQEIKSIIGGGGTVTIAIAATEVGSESSAAVGDITVVVSDQLGLTCSNPGALVGTDDETDAHLQIRMSDAASAISPNGPRDIYEYVALHVARIDGSTICDRVGTSLSSTTGHVTVTVAGPDGPVDDVLEVHARPDGSSGLLTDLGFVDWYLQRSAVPATVTLTTASATVVPIAVTYTAWVVPNATTQSAGLDAAIVVALASFMRSLPLGGYKIPGSAQGYAWVDGIRRAIADVSPNIFRVVVSIPSDNVSLDDSEVAALGTVAGTVVAT
jgi:hypothetical protein